MALTVKARRHDDIVLVECTGRLVFGEETTLLRAEVKQLLTESRFIVLDLARVKDVDSGGVGTLVGLYTSAQAAGGDLKLVNANKKILQTLKITRLLGIIKVYDREQDAVTAFRLERTATAS